MKKLYYPKYSFTSIDEKIKYICNYHYLYFFNKANVQGIGLSYKVKKGFCTSEKCIRVCVSRKICKNKLKSKDLIPKYYKGIKTDVFESGIFMMDSLRDRIRPAICGYNIGPISEPLGGTLGCLVTDGLSIYILSNNHVIAGNNSLPIGTEILQPSVQFGGKKVSNIIANLSKFVPLVEEIREGYPINTVDCAIAKVSNKSLVNPNIAFLGPIKAVKVPTLKENIQKVGSATELTKGKVDILNFACKSGNKGKIFFMANLIGLSKMSQSGDSGSILLDNNMNALGLLIGSSKTITSACLMVNVLNYLNVRIITG